MSILSRLAALFDRNETVQKTGTEFVRALAQEAIDSGDPSALSEVAALWDSLKSGEAPGLVSSPAPAAALPASSSASFTTADEMQELVLEIMRGFWMSGKRQATNGDIRKELDRKVESNGGWKDGDLEDWDESRPGIQHRWRRTLTECLRMMRTRKILENGSDAWKTYTLCPKYQPRPDRALPSIEAFQSSVKVLENASTPFEREPGWDLIG